MKDVIFTEDQSKQIIENYKSGILPIDIAYSLKVDEGSVRKVLAQNYIDRRYGYRNKLVFMADELTTRIIDLYNDGVTLEDIGHIVKVGHNNILQTIKENNVGTRKIERQKIYSRNSNYFDVIDTPNKAYFLGMLFADGCNCIHNGRYFVILSLQIDDKYIVDKFKEELEYEGSVSILRKSEQNPNYKDAARITISDEHLSKQLNMLGMVPNKSLVVKFPTCVPDELLSHFVRGYYDGNGNIYHYDKNDKVGIQICSTLDFCQVLSDKLLSMGCKNSIFWPKQSKGKSTRILKITGNRSSKIFTDWIYQDAKVKMIRKYNLYVDLCNYYKTDPVS